MSSRTVDNQEQRAYRLVLAKVISMHRYSMYAVHHLIHCRHTLSASQNSELNKPELTNALIVVQIAPGFAHDRIISARWLNRVKSIMANEAGSVAHLFKARIAGH